MRVVRRQRRSLSHQTRRQHTDDSSSELKLRPPGYATSRSGFFRESGRALDVCEEEGDGAGREVVSHAGDHPAGMDLASSPCPPKSHGSRRIRDRIAREASRTQPGDPAQRVARSALSRTTVWFSYVRLNGRSTCAQCCASPSRRARGARPRVRRLRDAAVPRRARASDPAARPRHYADRRDLGIHRLPAVRLRRNADRRSPWRHVRKEADTPRRDVGASRRLVDRRARDDASGVDRSPRDPRHWRRDVPTRIWDHPRRVPARASGRRDRAHLGSARDRRWPRHRARRADHRQPGLPLALLDPVRRHRRDGGRHHVLHSGVAHPGPRLGRLAWRRIALVLARLPLARDQRGAAVGMGIGTNDRAARRRGRGRSRVGRRRGPDDERTRRHADDAAASGLVDEPGRVPDRLRSVQRVRAHPSVRPDPAVKRLRLRLIRDPVGPVPRSRRR